MTLINKRKMCVNENSYVIIDDVKRESVSSEKSAFENHTQADYSIISLTSPCSFNTNDVPEQKKKYEKLSRLGHVNKFIDQMSCDATSTPLGTGSRHVSKVGKLIDDLDISLNHLPDGCYHGQVKHKHGKLIGTYVTIQVLPRF